MMIEEDITDKITCIVVSKQTEFIADTIFPFDADSTTRIWRVNKGLINKFKLWLDIIKYINS